MTEKENTETNTETTIAIDELGNRYGRLVVVDRAKPPAKAGGRAWWKCVCDCGHTAIVSGVKLRNGSQSACHRPGGCADNPFANPILRGNYGAAYDLKRLAVHLFNGCATPDMAMIMRRDSKHRALAFAMLEHYAEHGENDPVFLRVARALAEELLGGDADQGDAGAAS